LHENYAGVLILYIDRLLRDARLGLQDRESIQIYASTICLIFLFLTPLNLSRLHQDDPMDTEKNYDNVQTYSPWRKLVLIIMWSVEVIVLALNVIIMGLLIGITKPGSGNEKGGVQA
jgi:hypothetical protein